MPYADEERKREHNRAYYAATKERRRHIQRECERVYREANKEVLRERARAYREANRARISERNREQYDSARQRNWGLRYKYKIDEVQWAAMFEAQGRRCAVCSTDAPDHKHGWATDHCHATGKVRGVLCQRCNKALGYVRDNPDVLRRAADYLDRHKAQG